MTQEEKHTLLVSLFGYLPYGIKVNLKLPNNTKKIFEDHIGDLEEINKYGGYLVNSKGIAYRGIVLDIVPYLRPMSSMTDEERAEYFVLSHRDNDRDDNEIMLDEAKNLIDWLNEHHLDYHELIPKGLALESTDEMYNIKKGE